MLKKIKIQCPAKINLNLKIVGKRQDGYHDIDSVMQTVNLFDFLTITIDENPENEIVLSGTSDEIPYDEKNLVYKAANLFLEYAKINGYKINVFIEKNIPIAAGLAGGSTDGAGMIYGLNQLFEKPLTNSELHKLCAKLGSDLNLCLEGGRQKTSGRGEILQNMEFLEFNVSLIKPNNIGISAKEAYTKFSQKYYNNQFNKYNREDFVNDLEWAILEDYPTLEQIKNKYPNSIMSGSGSTFFIVNSTFENETDFWVKNNLKTISYGVKEV